MSAPYSGDAANITTPIAASVTSTIDAILGAPFILGTAAPHGYNTGEYVHVPVNLGGGVLAGLYQITVGSASQFELDGTSGTGGGTTTYGAVAVYNNSLTPQIIRPSDGDLRTAASLRVAVDALADRSQYFQERAVVQPENWIFTASGTLVVLKTGLYQIECIGGGGGGGGGCYSVGSVNAAGSGGGGGAGAKSVQLVELTAGDNLTITCGAAGAAGTAGLISGIVAPGDGGAGGTTQVQNAMMTVVCAGLGGGGGAAGQVPDDTATSYVAGGLSPSGYVGTIAQNTLPALPGKGGLGRRVKGSSQPLAAIASQTGGSSNCQVGGAPGTDGTAAGPGPTYSAGMGGGGGGAPDFFGAYGGDGGAGGNANAAGFGVVGTAGSAGYGGGGGGGGGTGGAGSSGGRNGGAGGAGGVGVSKVTYLGRVGL